MERTTEPPRRCRAAAAPVPAGPGPRPVARLPAKALQALPAGSLRVPFLLSTDPGPLTPGRRPFKFRVTVQVDAGHCGRGNFDDGRGNGSELREVELDQPVKLERDTDWH